MPRKKKNAAAKQSKTSFVLSQPADISANEVAAKAKAAGLAISPAYVYTIRSNAKRAGAKAKKGRVGRPKGSKNAGTARGTLKAIESQLQSWVVDHGGHAVRSMLDTVTARLRRLV